VVVSAANPPPVVVEEEKKGGLKKWAFLSGGVLFFGCGGCAGLSFFFGAQALQWLNTFASGL